MNTLLEIEQAQQLTRRDEYILKLEKRLVSVRKTLMTQEDKSCLGSGSSPDCGEWSIIDEVIDSINKTLS